MARKWGALLVLVCAALVASAAVSAQNGATYTTISLTGSAAPGVSAATFNWYATPAMNQLGQVTFPATVNGATADSDSGIWMGTEQSLTLVARESDAAPGQGSGVVFGDLSNSNPTFNASSQVAFFNILQGSAVVAANSQSLWIGGASSPALLARGGNAAPGTPANFVGFGAPDPLNNSDQVAFHGFLSNSNDGIWTGTTSGLQHLASTGAPAPGAGAGATFFSFGNGPVMNAAGTAAFAARITAPTLFDGLPQGVWLGTPGNLAAVAARNDAAPGAGGATFSSFSEPRINTDGSVAFSAVLSDNSRGIWVTSTSGLSLVARTGLPAPGTANTFINVDAPVIGAGGHLGFGGRLNNFDTGMWAGTSDSISLIARTGDVAPGGGTLGTIGANTINAHGQIAFFSTVNGAAGPSAIFAVDQFGALVRVVGINDSIPVSETQSRSVLGFAFATGAGGSDGRPISFNDAGHLAYRVSFSDGSNAVMLARVGGAARFSLDPPIYGPSAVPAAPELIVQSDGPGRYVPAIANVSVDAGYVRYSGIAAANPVFVYLKVIGGSPAVEAVRRELQTGATTYGYTVSHANPSGPLAGFNLLLVYASSTGGGTHTFSWNFKDIPGASLDSLAIVPEPVMLHVIAAISAVSALRRRSSRSRAAMRRP